MQRKQDILNEIVDILRLKKRHPFAHRVPQAGNNFLKELDVGSSIALLGQAHELAQIFP